MGTLPYKTNGSYKSREPYRANRIIKAVPNGAALFLIMHQSKILKKPIDISAITGYNIYGGKRNAYRMKALRFCKKR